MEHSRKIDRRRLLTGAAAVLTVPWVSVLAGCGDDEPAAGGPITLSVFWWGGEKRAELTERALAAYTAAHPDVKFETIWQGNAGYAEKLATLASSGSPPDIFQLDDNMLAEFASRNVTLDLGPLRDAGKLDVSKFPESLWQYGVVGDRLSAVALGQNTQAVVYNRTLLDRFRLPAPTAGMTWDAYFSWAAEVTKASRVAGSQDSSADYKALWVWLRDRGKDLYTTGSKLGFTADDITAWFTMWLDARAKGATTDAPTTQAGNSSDITKSPLITGKSAAAFVWSNSMPELGKSTKDALGMTSYPGRSGAQWARAAMYLTGARATKHPDTVADVLNFLVNDVEAGKILGTERGLPPNLDVRAAVRDTVSDEYVKQVIAVETELAKNFGSAPPVPPKGHAKVRSELVKIAESVTFGKQTPADAARAYVDGASSAIAG
jgi:multiple sugar transport system substrate-binding protein